MTAKVIVLHPDDNVGTALEDLSLNELIELPGLTLLATEDVPFGFKIALRLINQGAPIVKYGEPIGIAKSSVSSGSCVHVHNVESQRGRGDLG
jgi:hypothetical protein